MKILVLGCGAIGGYFGGRMQQAGLDITFLVREHRQKLLRENGLSITSPFGDAHFQVNTVTEDSLSGAYDLILLTCKSYDLDDAIDTISPAVGNDTIVLPLLNGLNHFQKLDEKLNTDRVLGSFCYLSVTMDEAGKVHHLSSSHSLTFGARRSSQSALIKPLLEILSPANFNVKMSDDILTDLWEKFTFLCAAAAVNCMMRGNIGDIMNTQYGHQVIVGTLDECNAVASAYGYFPRAKDKLLAMDQLTEVKSSFEASMYKDLKIKHQTEFDHIVGDMVKKGQEAGVHTPYLLAALTHLEVYENSLKMKSN